MLRKQKEKQVNVFSHAHGLLAEVINI